MTQIYIRGESFHQVSFSPHISKMWNYFFKASYVQRIKSKNSSNCNTKKLPWLPPSRDEFFTWFKWRGKLCPAFWPSWWADGSMESLDQTHGLLDLSLKNRHNTHILNSYTMLYTFTNIFIPPRVTGTALQAELPGSHDLRLLVFLLLYMLYSRNFQKVNLCKQAWFSSLRRTLDCVASCMADDLPCLHLPLWMCYVIERCANLAHQQSLTRHIMADF